MVAEQRGFAAQTERHAEMAEYMKGSQSNRRKLLVEEWSLLVVYKSAIGSRRAAWLVITSVEQKEKFKDKEQLASYARAYVAKVEGELQKIRDGILALMDKNLVPSAGTDDSMVFYYKMKGDYYRYLAEFATGDAKGKAAEGAWDACVEANKIAGKGLVVNHPVRLAMAMNSSVLQSEVFETTDEACEMARVAFKDAIEDPDNEVGVKALITDVITRLQAESSPQMQFIDKVVDVAVVTQQAPSVQTVQKATEIPQLQCLDNVIDVPVVEVVQVPQVQVMEKTVEIPQLHIVEEIVEIPEIQMVQDTQTRESLDTSRIRQAAHAELVEAVEI